MAIQLIFVAETNRQCGSDDIYIRSAINRFYDGLNRTDIKISTIYMNGKGHYKDRSITKQINDKVKAYSNNGESYVIYCFDTDKYESKSEDAKAFCEEEQYCNENGYEFVWFCHDVEEVFLGQTIEDNKKKQEAVKFRRSNGIENIKESYLKAKSKSTGKSNLLLCLNKFFSGN
ncbi:MAG: hypothetical protein E7302_16200 [Butyrivibrio sp.]|nr:hypothetical protein [Butyrivibrio sp.]